MGTENPPSLYEETLTARVRSVLRQVAPLAHQQGFYLAGGTAVALYLGHRRSIDLDWFRQEPLNDPLQLGQWLIERGIPTDSFRIAKGTLYLQVSGVKVGFFEYRYPLLRPLFYWQDYCCTLASLEDLACMKLLAIAQRGAKRDFVDIYAISSVMPLSEMVELYKQKYGVSDIAHLLRALIYFDDADRECMPSLRWSLRWSQVKSTLTNAVKQLT